MAATVPHIDTATLDTATGRQRIQADDSAFGAASARAMQSVAQGLGNVARVASEKEQEFATADAQNMDNALSARMRQRLYDPTKGYLSAARGQNALLRRGEIEAQLQQDFNEIDLTAPNDRARALYREVAGRRIQGALDSISTHLANESRTAQTDALNATVSEAVNNAAAAWASPAERDRQFATIDSAVSEAARLNGWSDVVTLAHRREARSNVYSTVLGEMAVTAPQEAEVLFEQISPELDEQTRGQLRTTMRVAQREYIDTIEGQAWQAFANGQPLNSMDPQAYQQLTTNPLLGTSHARLREAYRTRAQSYANGAGRPQNDSPTYWGLRVLSMTNPQAFQQQLPQILASPDGATMSNGDIGRLLERSMEIQQGGGANGQTAVFNSVRSVAEPMLGRYGLDLTPTQSEFGQGSNLTSAQRRVRNFDALLAQEVAGFVTNSGGRQPNPVETQEMIGRAIIRMNADDVNGIERNTGTQGLRADVEGRDAEVSAAVVPYNAIPQDSRRAIIADYQRRNNGAIPSRGQVETRYAQYLQAQGQ